MPEDQLRNIVEGIRARLQAELESHLGSVTEKHEQALADVRRTAEADAEHRWAAELDAARAQWDARLQSEVAAARSEVERTMVADSMRIRLEAEQAAAEAASQARQDLERAVAAERQRAQEEVQRATAQIEDVRQRAQEEVQRAKTQFDELRQRTDRELTDARAAADAERVSTAAALAEARNAAAGSAAAAAAAAASGVGAAAILEAIRAIDNTSSLSAALAAVARAAAAEAPRVALFVVNGAELHEWPVDGVPSVDSGPIRADGRDAGFLGDVLRTGEPQTIGPDGGAAPAFARLPPGRSAIAVPFMLGGQAVAVLYADDATNGKSSGAWRETVHILGRHASAFLAYLTAARTAQARQFLSGAEAGGTDDDAQGARRYARLLVSEIKLYNEGAVRVGRERRDLLRRLKGEIDRARKLYEERVAPSITARDSYFQQELVQTLADGDQTLLG